MRFLFLTPRLHNNYYEVIKALLEHGHTVGVGVLYTLPTERYELVQPVVLGYARSFLRLKRWFQPKTTSALKNRFELRYGFPSPIALWRLMRTSQADVVMIKNIDSVYSFLAMCFARLLGKKMVISLQIEKHRSQPKSGSVALVGALFGAKVITPLLGDTQYVNENTNLYYIPFTQAVSEATVDRRTRTGPIRILCVAKFQKRKNQLLLLRALKKLPNTLAFELHLVGQQGEQDYLAAIRQLIAEEGMQGHVLIRCDLPWEAMREEYRWADLYVLPSASEPAAVSILEAMSFGLPVMCSDQNGTRWYVDVGGNGYIFRSGDEEYLTKLLHELIADRLQLARMGARSLELVAEHHSPEKTYQLLMEALKEDS